MKIVGRTDKNGMFIEERTQEGNYIAEISKEEKFLLSKLIDITKGLDFEVPESLLLEPPFDYNFTNVFGAIIEFINSRLKEIE